MAPRDLEALSPRRTGTSAGQGWCNPAQSLAWPRCPGNVPPSLPRRAERRSSPSSVRPSPTSPGAERSSLLPAHEGWVVTKCRHRRCHSPLSPLCRRTAAIARETRPAGPWRGWGSQGRGFSELGRRSCLKPKVCEDWAPSVCTGACMSSSEGSSVSPGSNGTVVGRALSKGPGRSHF